MRKTPWPIPPEPPTYLFRPWVANLIVPKKWLILAWAGGICPGVYKGVYGPMFPLSLN